MKRLILSALAAVFATAASAQQGDQPLIKVRVAYDGYSMTSGPLIYGEKTGLFKKFGLDVTPTFIDGGSTLTQAVVGGSVDIAQNGYTPSMAAAVQGADIVLIGGMSNKLPFQLVVKNEITNAEQLKGKNIAISKYGSSTDTAADFAIKSLGLKRTDVTILQLGGASTRIAAAISGQIAGTMEQYPDTAELSHHGFHVLADVTDIAGEYPNTAYVTSRTFLKKNPDVVKRYMMAISTAIREYKTHPEVAIPLTQEFLKIKDADAMKAAYESYSQHVYPDIPRPSLKGMELVLQEMSKDVPKAASVKPADLVDTSTLDELEREGFFKKLLM
ncbi:MAG: NitT/TauT family transport system substrate-binding protein [Alphaproteobacteria bacterium]|jgi:NitT/TauT family transport system substrate-binding protein|nr:NitT/TauT family transport system substrate-binding protein [Alphaproteobacteria bacterium]